MRQRSAASITRCGGELSTLYSYIICSQVRLDLSAKCVCQTIEETHLHLRNVCQATSCKITARCVATKAGFESLRAKYDRETDDYRCDLPGDGDFADLGCVSGPNQCETDAHGA